MDYDVKHVSVPDTTTLTDEIGALFANQPLAVLSTHADGQPHSSLVAFACREDLSTLLFATTRATRKYANIEKDPRVSLLIDNRSNKVADFHDAVAVTVTGTAHEVSGDDKTSDLSLYLSKHPHLEDFVTAPSSALIRVTVDTYEIVTRFQHVMKLHMKQ